MKKKVLILLVMIAILLAAAIPALATPAEDVQGDWFYHPRLDEVELVKIVGNNTFFRTVEDSRWNGTFQGSEACIVTAEENCASSVDSGPVVIHRSGLMNFQGWVRFDSVTVNGATGSLEMRVSGIRPATATDWQGQWVITGGELHQAGLRGQGPWWGPGWQEVPGQWGIIHYSGSIHYE